MDTLRWDRLNEEIIACTRCARLVEWREKVAREKRKAYRDWDYWGKPVPGFGDRNSRVLVVGLAPGAHGANRTGRIFTGDSSGEFLFRALHKAGFANQPHALHSQDGLELSGLYISATCRCAPPDNKPLPGEVANCLPYLQSEIDEMPPLVGFVVLGKIAFDTVLRILRERGHAVPPLVFSHCSYSELGSGLPWMIASYHPSRQNTQTGRLTEEMFDSVWSLVREKLDQASERTAD